MLGKEYGSLCAVGVGGKVRKGGNADGRCRVVYRGSKSSEAGVQSLSRRFNTSFEPCREAVVDEGEAGWMLCAFIDSCSIGSARSLLLIGS